MYSLFLLQLQSKLVEMSKTFKSVLVTRTEVRRKSKLSKIQNEHVLSLPFVPPIELEAAEVETGEVFSCPSECT